MNRQKKIYQKLKRKAQRVKKRQSPNKKPRYIPKAERDPLLTEGEPTETSLNSADDAPASDENERASD